MFNLMYQNKLFLSSAGVRKMDEQLGEVLWPCVLQSDLTTAGIISQLDLCTAVLVHAPRSNHEDPQTQGKPVQQ